MKELYIFVPKLDNNAPVKIAKNIAVESLKDFNTTLVPFRSCATSSYRGVRVRSFGLWFLSLVFKKHSFIVHSHGFFPDLLSILFSFSNKVNTISTVHSDIEKELFERFGYFRGFILFRLWIICLRLKNNVVFLNDFVFKKYNDYIPNCSSVIYNGADVTKYKKVKSDLFDNSNITIGCIGRIVSVKGFEQVVKMVVKNPDYNLIIAGDGPNLGDLKNDSKQCLDRIKFLGSVSDLSIFYSQIDLVVIPSRSEGFPLVLIESTAQGIPIVVSDIPQFKEFSSVVNSVIFRLDDIDSLKNAVNAAISYSNCFWKVNSDVYVNNFTNLIMYSNYKKIYFKKNDNI